MIRLVTTRISGNGIRQQMYGHKNRISGEQTEQAQSAFPLSIKDTLEPDGTELQRTISGNGIRLAICGLKKQTLEEQEDMMLLVFQLAQRHISEPDCQMALL